MAERQINTGQDVLDRDLTLLFEITSEEEARANIQAALANETLSVEDLNSALPRGLWPLLTFLRTPSRYQWLLDNTSDQARHDIEEARKVVEEHLTDLFKHPAYLEVVNAGAKVEEADEEEGSSHLQDTFRVISGIAHVPSWDGPQPHFQPAVRVLFFDDGKKVLLDTTADWDTLLFLARSLAEIFAEQLKSGKNLVEHIKVDASEREKLARNLTKLKDALERIKKLAPIYGIHAECDDPSQDDDSSSTE